MTQLQPQSGNVLDRIESSIPDAEDATADQLLELLDKLDFVAERMAQIEARLMPAVIKFLEAGGKLERGTVFYTINKQKETKCRNAAESLQQILELLGTEEAANCLASQPWKHGAVKKLIAKDDFERLFETKEKKSVELKVHKVDRAFLK